MADAPKILLVDDDEFILDMYSLKFRESGFDLDVASTGADAVEKLKKKKFDMVLLDIVMPSLDGFETLRRIKKEKIAEGSKIILLTNLGQKDDIERGMSLGADDYIVKAHFTPHEVVEKIKHHLGRT